jgi:hypothetical protein
MPICIRMKSGITWVSVEDAPLADSRWRVTPNGYAIRSRRVNGRRVTEYLHRVVAKRAGLLVDSLDVDHIDGDRLNNTRVNLRTASRAQNQHNRRTKRTGASQFKGVSRIKDKWRATIVIDGKQLYLGLFDQETDAARTYAKAAAEAFGAYAAPVVRKKSET